MAGNDQGCVPAMNLFRLPRSRYYSLFQRLNSEPTRVYTP